MKLNRNKIIIAVVVLIEIVLISILSFGIYKDFFEKDNRSEIGKKELDSIKLYGYTLDDRDTEVYKQYFEELKEILNKDEVDKEKYAEAIAKIFVVDFYTLSNKLASTDIGSLEFIHPNLAENFKLNAGDTIYHHIKSNIFGDRQQDLPEVSEVQVSEIKAIKYSYNDKEYEGYEVSISWSYVEDLGYETNSVLKIIYDNNKMNVVENSK